MGKKDVKQNKSFINSRKIQLLMAFVLIVCVVIVGIKAASNGGSEEANYRETTVLYGNLTVGVTENGTIDIGTVEQTFDLDMSALQRVSTSNSSSSGSSTGGFGGDMSGMGGMVQSAGNSSGSNNMFGQMFTLGGSSTSSSSNSSSKLVIESINVSVGQTISTGDVLLTLEKEGVDELKSELESNVDKASADLEALVADQKLSTITADYTLENALSYGDYALKEKNAEINSLSQDVSDAKDALNLAKESLARYKEQLALAQTDYNNAVIAMNKAVWARENADVNADVGNYINAFNDAATLTSNAETLENKLNQLESKVKSAENSVSRCETNLAKAKRAYDSGVITAQETYEIRMLAYNTAQETYDITISYLEDNLNEQQENYDDTVSKWEEFTSYIDGYDVRSEYNGVITAIDLAEGDKLGTGSVVVTLYDADDVTMTVTVSEDDMTDIELGGLANINLTAYPDEVFVSEVTEIGDASTDSSGNTTCEVTVTLSGDVSRLFQGMTGEVTFITKQISNIFYVSNRAIIRENGVSYVKIKNDNGNIEKVKVKTGFSDGVNVEIIEGLSEGQTVIIEKGDSK